MDCYAREATKQVSQGPYPVDVKFLTLQERILEAADRPDLDEVFDALGL
jgi:hypothetical protein